MIFLYVSLPLIFAISFSAFVGPSFKKFDNFDIIFTFAPSAKVDKNGNKNIKR